MDPFAAWMENLPEVNTPFTGLEGRLIAGPHGQTVFFRADEELEVPPHAHEGGQWGVVVTGRMRLTVDGEEEVYEPGGTYNVPSNARHSALLEAGTAVIDVFEDPNRYEVKPA